MVDLAHAVVLVENHVTIPILMQAVRWLLFADGSVGILVSQNVLNVVVLEACGARFESFQFFALYVVVVAHYPEFVVEELCQGISLDPVTLLHAFPLQLEGTRLIDIVLDSARKVVP